MKKKIKILIWLTGCLTIICIALTLICNQIVVNNAEGKVFSDIDSIKYNKVGLLLFTPTMIADAYSAYIMAVGEDEYIEKNTEYQESLRKEQRCWDDLLECRKKTSQLLAGDIKKVYDIGTNQMIRIKLYQLKNQNQDFGMISGEVMKCALPENCSDIVLLEYPSFDKIWAKHCENLDWYPNYDY